MIALLAACVLAGLASTVILIRSFDAIDNANEVVNSAERVASSLKDVETGYRGFLIVGDPAYLEPYDAAIGEVDVGIAALGAQAAHDAGLARLFPPVDAAVRAKLAYAAEIVDLYRTRSPEAARARFDSGEGRRRMDEVRARIADMQRRARRDVERVYRQGVRPAGAALLVSLLLLAGATLYFVVSASRLRRASQRASQLMADMIGRAPVGVAIVTRGGGVAEANPAFRRLAGMPEDARSGLPLATDAPDLHAGLAGQIAVAATGFRATWKSQPSTPVEIIRDGRTLHLTATVFPVEITGGDGRDTTAAGVVLNDITRQKAWELELEQARDEAEQANRAKSAFIANMSHELRTPLTAVLGYSELLEEEIRDLGEDSLLGDLGKIAMNARHLLGLINDVLDLSKIEAQKMDVNVADVDVARLIEEVEAAAGGLMEKNGNRFVVEAGDAPATMVSDDLKLKQILLNLIGNAAKFTTGGTITLAVAAAGEDGERVRFVVRDTGIGMSAEQIERLFERFRQADETTTRKYGGTGLGLALTRALTILLHGTVRVQSREGEGTCFTVEVPRRHLAREEPAAEAEADRPETTGSILVVDDDPAAREVMERILTRAGFRVAVASDGAQALEKARALRPAAILLDVVMPVMDGWNVLRALRADAETSDIPVIMQTLLDEEHFAYAHGANGYLRKPIRRTGLLEALAGVAPTGDRRVLVVDDDSAARGRLTRVLRRNGWAASEAADGAEALAAIPAAAPDLILVDLVMPGMDGHAFIRRVRERPEWSRIPIIVLTAEDIDSADVRALETSAADIIQKGSMPLNELVASLRRYIADADSPAGADDAETA